MIIGITGVIGSGKTEAMKTFNEFGFLFCSSDDLVKIILDDDPVVSRLLEAKWGEGILDPQGMVDKERIRECIKADPHVLEWFEALLHPKVNSLRNQLLEKCPESNWVLEIPLLFEKKLEKICDFTVCISVSTEVQDLRLHRRNLDSAYLDALKKRQWSQQDKEAASDFIIYNNGSKEFLRNQINLLIEKLRS